MESLAKRHNLFPLLYVQLQRRYRNYSENEDIRSYLSQRKTLFLGNAARSMCQEVIEKEIVALFYGKCIPAIVIKGNQIAKEIYNDPSCRNSADIDILIKLSDAIQADQLLTTAGYTRTDPNPLGFWFSRLHHAQYLYPQKNDLIEIHWNFGIPSFFNLLSEEIWNEVNYRDSDNVMMSPDMMVIQLLIHHHLHSFRELKILVDIFWTLHKYENSIDWHIFTERIRKIGLIKTTQITLNQIQSLWKDYAQDIQCLQTLNHKINQMGYKTPVFLNSYFKMDINNSKTCRAKKDNIIFRLALDRWPTIIFSLLKSILPLPEAIRHLYGDPRNSALPGNYLRFLKWRLEEWIG